MDRKIVVTREQVITPLKAEYNDFEDMFVSPDDGSDAIKVTKKHKDVQDLILQAIEGKRAVRLDFSEYMNKEYVARAEYFDGTPSKQVSNAPQSTGSPVKVQSSTKTHGDNRSYVLSYAKDVAVAMITSGKECTVKTVLDVADQFLAWMNKE
jgi:hypothetical protein